MSGTCGTCKHWLPLDYPRQGGSPQHPESEGDWTHDADGKFVWVPDPEKSSGLEWGECLHASFCSVEPDRSQRFVFSDLSQAGGYFVTRIDFGCVEHEEKADD